MKFCMTVAPYSVLRLTFATSVLFLLGLPVVNAQDRVLVDADRLESITPQVAFAVSIEEAPSLDGHVLGDEVWDTISPVTEFRQSAPDEGRRGSRRDRHR